MFSDTSLTGWGAVCNGIQTHGFWSTQDKRHHINYLELLAVFHALRCFASHLKGSEILLRINNSTAVRISIGWARLNSRPYRSWHARSGVGVRNGTYSFMLLISLQLKISRQTRSHASGQNTEWTLEQGYFDRIKAYFGPFEIDLFATCINKKCQRFVSWHPDPLAYTIDVFSLDRSTFYFYAFPLFALILKVLRKIITDKARGVIVVSWWPAQPWFPLFNQLIIN